MSDRGFDKIRMIAWREFRHTVLTKSFLLGAIGVPILMSIGLLAMPALMVSQFTQLKGELAVVDPTGTIGPALRQIIAEKKSGVSGEDVNKALQELGLDNAGLSSGLTGSSNLIDVNTLAPDITIRSINGEADLDQLKQQARDGELTGVAVIPPSLMEVREPDAEKSGRRASVELFVPTNASPRHITSLRNMLQDAVVQARVEGAGRRVEAVRSLLSEPGVDLRRLGEAGTERSENVKVRMIIPMAFMMLIWIATFTSGNYLLTSTIEEKSNKVIEVVLSAVGPLQLLWGKILGLAAVALIIMFMYGGLAIAALAALAMTDLLSLKLLLWSGFFFVVAYFTIASIMTAVGSAVNDLREAQSLIGPVMIVLILPMLLWMPISENPNGTVAVVSSMLPPIQPFAMVMRLASANEPVPEWQIWLGAGIGAMSVFAFVWGAARIFRVGVLMQGKPPSPFELLRWIRQS